MTDVVILYDGEDESLIAPIAAQARALGLDVRQDPQQEQDELNAELVEKQIDEAGALLLCWSEHSVAMSAIRTRAAIASARGKLASCKLAPCSIPFPFDAAPTVDMQDWAARPESAEWRELVAALGDKLHRPGLVEALQARISGDEDALNAFAKKYPDEPEARRIWGERETKYREECAAMLRDARQHLEQRVESERSKIETALAGFSRDFDAWLERERRGEASPKPSLNTLFEILLERGGRRASTPSDENLKQSAARSEAKALALQERLDAESTKLRELERKLQSAELLAKSTVQPLPSVSPTLSAPARKGRERSRFTSLAAVVVVAVGAATAAKLIHGSEREPPQVKAAIDWLQQNSTTIEARARVLFAELAAKYDERDALGDLLAADREKTIARAIAFDPQTALARLKDVAPEQFASGQPAPVAPSALLANMSERDRGEMVSALVKAAPSEVVAQLLTERKSEVIDQLLRADPAALSTRLAELAPKDAPAATPAPSAAPIDPPAIAAQQTPVALAQLPAREIKALEASAPPQTSTDLVKPPPAAPPPKVVSYRTYENRDIGSDHASKLRNYDLQTCVAACRKKENCKAYTFDKWNRVCYLKSTIGDFKLNPRSSSGLREDVRVPRAPSGDVTMERYPSRAFPGSGYKSVKSDGPDACEISCRSEDACVAFTFRLDEGSCHLFRSTGEYFRNELADSGGKRQD